VILTADDPSMFSSQNEQDNRYYARFAGLPMLEPSSVDEARAMVATALDLSERLQQPVLLRTTTRINHSSGSVTLGPIRPRRTRGEFNKDPMNLVVVPAVARRLHVKLLKNLEAAQALAEQSPCNLAEGDGPWGIICNGVSFNYVRDAVRDLGIAGKTRVLRLGFAHPFPRAVVQEFLRGCERVLVVEEGEPLMEEAAKVVAQEAGLTLPIRGKAPDLFSRLYEYDPAMVRRAVARCFGLPDQAPTPVDLSDLPPIPQRPPTLCAGCSHRATLYAVKKAAEGMDAIFPSDIGCYTLGFLPPLSMADYVVCMGMSTGCVGGFAQATGRKIVSFIGDSTFFHSGIPGLINAVFNRHHFTLVILDNGTTAMTGHQPHPGVDMTQLGVQGHGRVSIENLVRGIGVSHVTVIKPYKVKKSIEAVREALRFPGVSVVISQEVCALYARTIKLPKRKPFQVTAKCTNHRTCLNELACPAFYVWKDRVHIDPDLCTGCALCAQVCPENAILPVKGAD
jgi:indolepyruvate ferredoxin oxidoreductase alpha subunit